MSRRYFARNLGNNTAFDNAYATFLNTLDVGGEPEPLKQIQDFSKSELFFLQNAGFTDLINIPQGNFDDEVPSIVGSSLTVTGGGNGSRFDKDGVIETGLPNNRPRYTYNPTNLAYEGVYIEKGSKNDITPSNLSNWTSDNTSSSTIGSGVTPIISAGYDTLWGISGDKIVLDLDGGTDINDRSGIYFGLIPSNLNTDYRFSFYIKILDGSDIEEVLLQSAFGSLVTGARSDSYYIDLGSNIYYISHKSHPAASGTCRFQILGLYSDLNSIDCVVYGEQLENSSIPTSLMPIGVSRSSDSYTSAGVISGSSYGVFTRDQLGKRIDYLHDGNKYTYRNGALESTVVESPSTDLVISSQTGSDKVKTIALRLGTMSEYELKAITSL